MRLLLQCTLLSVILAVGQQGDARPEEINRLHPSPRQELIGAWRLMGITYMGPKGDTIDPFYQSESSGIIIYDAAGWMSVQIGASRRRSWDVPMRRGTGEAPRNVRLKAEAFDTYYSYFGTWDYDSATAVVTHHLRSSLIAAENGTSYAQTVSFDSGRLILTVRSGRPGAETVRRKIWERLSAG